jgi:hypothetical protein
MSFSRSEQPLSICLSNEHPFTNKLVNLFQRRSPLCEQLDLTDATGKVSNQLIRVDPSIPNELDFSIETLLVVQMRSLRDLNDLIFVFFEAG